MKKRIALYDPYLDILGGGEKHILSILQVLGDKNHEIDIFWNQNLNNEIKNKLNLHFQSPLNYLPNIFLSLRGPERISKKFERGRSNPVKVSETLLGLPRSLTLPRNDALTKLLTLREYDIFFYVTDGSYFFSSAKKNFVFCMVPNRNLFPLSFLNRIKTFNYRFLTNSNFTNKWLSKHGIKADVIYPYLDNNFIHMPVKNIQKDKIILSVGRFFRHLHAKRQDLIINLFKQMKQKYSAFKDFRLILAGGLKNEDSGYFEELKQQIKGNDSIQILPNLGYNDLIKLYNKSLVYWHFTGFGVNEEQNPESVEHLGISPLEAMASGCITFCVNAGGHKEIINNGQTGFLFESENDLVNKMRLVLSSTALKETVQKKAKEYIKKNFSYDVFRKRVSEVIM